jgi:hypothetical protein
VLFGFGLNARTISGLQVQSAYSFRQGGDLDELRIYDQMLGGDQAKGSGGEANRP